MQNCAVIIPLVNSDTYQSIFIQMALNKSMAFKPHNKLLELIQVWAEGLVGYSAIRSHNNFLRSYSHLKSQRVRFPVIGPDTSKYIPPLSDEQIQQTTQLVSQTSLSHPPSSISSSVYPKQIEMDENFTKALSHIELLSDIFQNINPTTEPIQSNEIINEIFPSLDDYGTRLQQWIQSGNVSEEMFGVIIDVNDRINQLKQQYEDLKRGKRVGPPQSLSVAAPKPQIAKKTLFDLLDNSDSLPQTSNYLAIPAPPSPTRTPSPLPPMTVPTHPPNNNSPFHPVIRTGQQSQLIQQPHITTPNNRGGNATEDDDIFSEFASLANREPPKQNTQTHTTQKQNQNFNFESLI
jgi:hypothetical protein